MGGVIILKSIDIIFICSILIVCIIFLDNIFNNDMINKRLKEITKIITGYTFRTALKSIDEGGNLVVQAKDISDDLYINDDKFIKTSHQLLKSNALIKNNDILFSVRGKFRASVYNGNKNNIIASSSVYILRLIDDKVKSEYLTIYLNSKISQREINKILTGGAIKTILRKDLEGLSIKIPSTKEQQDIINLYKNNVLIQEKLKKKKEIINNVIEIAISKIIN